MKIYRMPVDRKLQPDYQSYVWPPQNQREGMDFGVEQDFDWWLGGSELLVDKIDDADWIYLPVYWNRYYINTPDKDGHWGGGWEALAEVVHNTLGYGIPTFTISEADEKVLHPQVEWGNLTQFCASRRAKGTGIDIPLLSAPHIVNKKFDKKYTASFLGNINTDGIRIVALDTIS